jgi:hypothetical protein
MPLADLKARLANSNILVETIEAVFDRYNGWAEPPGGGVWEQSGAGGAGAGGGAVAGAAGVAAAGGARGLIDRAVGFKEALQELVRDQVMPGVNQV